MIHIFSLNQTCYVLNLFKERQIQFWLPKKITFDGKFEKSVDQTRSESFSWTKSQNHAKQEILYDTNYLNGKNLLHFSNIDILNEISTGIVNQKEKVPENNAEDGSIEDINSSEKEDCEASLVETVEIIQQNVDDQQYCNHISENDQNTPLSTLTESIIEKSVPSLTESSIETKCDTGSSNSVSLSRKTMRNISFKKLQKQCNLPVRQIIFEKPENILPFVLVHPKHYPNIRHHKQQLRLNWIRNSLTEHKLGRFQN